MPRCRAPLKYLRLIRIGIDAILIITAYGGASLISSGGRAQSYDIVEGFRAVVWLVPIQAMLYFAFHINQTIWRYVGLWDVLRIVGASVLGVLLGLAGAAWVVGSEFRTTVFILDAILQASLLSGFRVLRRTVHELHGGVSGKRILIFGAGDAGEMVARDMNHNPYYGYRPVGFIDDDPAKVGGRIHGIPVWGSRQNLESVMDRVKPEEILIAMPGMPSGVIREIVRCLESYRVPIKTLPSLRDLINGALSVSTIRNIALEDLIRREPLAAGEEEIKRLLKRRRVMVTGAGGSIGSELCRQLLGLGVERLVMYERHENSLYVAENKLTADYGACGIEAVVGDVADPARLDETLKRCDVDLIYHAAAHKHVPIMEMNPCEAVKNNVRGTRIVLEAAIRNRVDRFVLVSTDKAVNPTNVMGATKRVAELLMLSAAEGCECKVGTVRFGNVLGSSGSVIPKFLEQIRKGGPVTVTHPAMRRFFMLIPEAVQLMLQATSLIEAGRIYVLEMGEQIKICDMARHLIQMCGCIPDDDITIEFTGMRPGEKLFEELIGDGEEAEPSGVKGILSIRTKEKVDEKNFGHAVSDLEKAAAANDTLATIELLERIVPTFQCGRTDTQTKVGRVRKIGNDGIGWAGEAGRLIGNVLAEN